MNLSEAFTKLVQEQQTPELKNALIEVRDTVDRFLVKAAFMRDRAHDPAMGFDDDERTMLDSLLVSAKLMDSILPPHDVLEVPNALET